MLITNMKRATKMLSHGVLMQVHVMWFFWTWLLSKTLDLSNTLKFVYIYTHIYIVNGYGVINLMRVCNLVLRVHT